MTDNAAEGTLFEQVAREPRLSDKVADLMLETILSRRLKVGDRLPSERELGEQFGVSRSVVREAVRALAAKGVIEARSGSGLRVAAVDAASVRESLKLFLRGGPIELERVHEVRAVIEVHVAGLAAERATPADIARMRELHDRMSAATGDVDDAARDDLEFHRAIARATHNDLFLLLLDSIASALIDIMRENLGSGSTPMALEQHRRILDPIVAGDVATARIAMETHLEDVRSGGVTTTVPRQEWGVKAAKNLSCTLYDRIQHAPTPTGSNLMATHDADVAGVV